MVECTTQFDAAFVAGKVCRLHWHHDLVSSHRTVCWASLSQQASGWTTPLHSLPAVVLSSLPSGMAAALALEEFCSSCHWSWGAHKVQFWTSVGHFLWLVASQEENQNLLKAGASFDDQQDHRSLYDARVHVSASAFNFFLWLQITVTKRSVNALVRTALVPVRTLYVKESYIDKEGKWTYRW
jgi:hypothetical protein